MTPITLTLPWPSPRLSPNARMHWAALAKAKKLYRAACYAMVLADKVKKPTAARLDVLLLFVPPDRRSYDRDNLVARMKSGLDGVAQAWGIDDSAFVRLSAEVSDTPAAGGRVLVKVTEHAAAGAAP